MNERTPKVTVTSFTNQLSEGGTFGVRCLVTALVVLSEEAGGVQRSVLALKHIPKR